VITIEIRRQLVRVLLVAGPLVTLIVTPWTSYDPINLSKLAVLAPCAGIALTLLLLDFKVLFASRYRTTVVVAALFKIDLLVVLLTSSSPFNEQFFGTNGRNTGYLAYISLLILFVAAVVGLDKSNTEKLLWSLFGAGVLSALYGLVQSAGLDPIKWHSLYSPVIGFLGNPDFQSSFLGICGVVAAGFLFGAKRSWVIRGVLISYLFLAIYVISKTKAVQGFLVLAIGVAVVVYLYIRSNRRIKVLGVPYLLLSAGAAVFVVIGSLNKGPLAHYLYKLSVTYRGDYWRAGWKMTLDHPFTGVGLDSYGDWYRASRSLVATLRRGPDITSNAAHNVFLDFSSNGGFPLLIAYLLIIGLTLASAIRVMRRTQGFDATHAALFGAWVAYLAQSAISLNQLGLAVWGWILSGALIAYEINTRVVEEPSKGYPKTTVRNGRNVQMKSSTPAVTIAIFMGLVVGLALGLPPLIADSKFRTSLTAGSAVTLEIAAATWPIDTLRLEQASLIFRRSKLEPQALMLAKRAAKYEPRSFDAWSLISSSTTATASEKADALAQMKFLDPYNPALK
jgi:O-antigen ligase